MEKLSAYEYFNAIVKTKSISAAADILGISQPALSSFIKRQEVLIGLPLIDRSTNPISITNAGYSYLNYLEKELQLSKEFQQEITDIENLKRGALVIGGAVFFNVTYLPSAISEFNAKYPNINLRIVDGTIPEITAAAGSGEIDVFTTPSTDDDSFEYEELFKESIFLCVPPKWEINTILPAANSQGFATLSVDDFEKLKDCTFITLHPEQDIGKKMQQIFDKHNFIPKNKVVVDQTLTSLELTLAGVGISLITESTLQSYPASKMPRAYYIDPEICSRSVYAAYPKNKYVSNAIKEFIKCLKKYNR